MAKVLLTTALLFGLSSPALADAPEPRLVTTTGNADIKVVPNEIEITLGIETRDRLLLAAKTQNNERLQKTLAALHSLNIDAKNVQTDYLTIEPEYSNNDRVVIAYIVRRRLAVVLSDLAKFETLLTSVLQAGVNYVHNVEFRTTELRKHRDRARLMAIQSAREKAIALAKELGQKVGRPHTITEGGGGWFSPGGWWGGRWGAMAQNVQSNSGGAPSESTGLSLGQITISAGVTVAFELE